MEDPAYAEDLVPQGYQILRITPFLHVKVKIIALDPDRGAYSAPSAPEATASAELMP